MSETVYLLTAAAETHPGRKRPNNEDYVAFFEPVEMEDVQRSGALYIVADGVGGAAKGEKASQFAAQKVLFEYYRRVSMPPAERLAQAMQEAGNEIYRYSRSGGRFIRMATTMVAAAFIDKRVIVANVGDSRAYLIRNGQVRQITRDHNLVGEMMREGVMTEEEALHSKVKNRLTRSLGGEPDPKVDLFEVRLQPGDRILLCSDGLTRYALTKDVLRMAGQGTPQEVVRRLIDFANESGGADNVSVILVEVGPEVTPQQWARYASQRQQPALAAVDLETIVTQPVAAQLLRRRRHWWDVLEGKQWWLAAVAGFVVACGLGTLFAMILWPRPTSAAPTPLPLPSLPTVPPQPTPSVSPLPPTVVSPEASFVPPTPEGATGAQPTSPPVASAFPSVSSPPLSPAPSTFWEGCFARLVGGSVYQTFNSAGFMQDTALSTFGQRYFSRYPVLLYLTNEEVQQARPLEGAYQVEAAAHIWRLDQNGNRIWDEGDQIKMEHNIPAGVWLWVPDISRQECLGAAKKIREVWVRIPGGFPMKNAAHSQTPVPPSSPDSGAG